MVTLLDIITMPPDLFANASLSPFMMPTDDMLKMPANAIMFTKKLKRRDPIAYDLLVSGTYKQRKVKSKRDYKRVFKNQREFELLT